MQNDAESIVGHAGVMRSWTTEVVPAAQRLDYWIGAICEGFLEMSATSPAAIPAFSSRLDSVAWGPVSVNRVRGSAQHVHRTGKAIARSTKSCFYLLCKTDLSWKAAQEDTGSHLQPGDLVLVDSRRRYEFQFPETADTVSLELLPAWLATWLPDPARLLGRRIDGHTGWGAVLSAFVQQLSPELALAPPLPRALLVDQLGALIGLAAGTQPPAEASSRAEAGLRARIDEVIRQRHAEAGLTALDVASGLGISVRTLHRGMAGRGQTFAQLLMTIRMEVARRMLSDVRFDRLHVAEIGRRVGLTDPSHFVRLCSSQLGATPGHFRRLRRL